MTTAASEANIAGASGSDSSSARLSGVVSRKFGGASRWRLRSAPDVSPLRVAMPTGSARSVTGRVRLRAMSAASAFSGLT